MPRCLQVIADDLSGAAECAAALAQAARSPAPLVLRGAVPAAGNWVIDTDSRALQAHEAAQVSGDIVRAAVLQGGGALLFKKIDSTLRGHIGVELQAALAVPDGIRAAVVCNALPTQGRTLREGVLYVHGQPRLDAQGRPIELPRLLAAADPRVALLRPPSAQTAAALARDILGAVEGGVRVVVVDAGDAEHLRRLALAIVLASRSVRLLAVGAAGLAKALATELLQSGGPEHPMLQPCATHFPIVGVIGSYAPVTLQQVDALARQDGVHLVRLAAASWLAQDQGCRQAVLEAQAHGARGEPVVLAIERTDAGTATRELVQRMADAAGPLLRAAATLVLTGGDTARAVLEGMGVESLQVLGELEPGICLSREGTRHVVTKAGGFGDSHSLVRVLRHLGADMTERTE